MRTVPSLVLVALLAPTATALVLYHGIVPEVVAPVSAPAFYSSMKYPVKLDPGDRIQIELAYANGGPSRDLDLVLFPPSSAPEVVNAATLPHYLANREARATCQDAAASAHAHPDNGAETFDVTLGPTAESGFYALYVLAYVQTSASPYEMGATVLDPDGHEITSISIGVPQAERTVNPFAHCDALLRE